MASVLIPASILAAALMAIPALFGDFVAWQFGLYLIYGIAAQGVGYVWGRTGALPLGQALFFGGAAYFAAAILRDVEGLATQLALFAGVVAVAGALAFGLAALVFNGRKDSGPYFSLITLALVMIAEQIAGTATATTGGFNGMSGFNAVADLDPFGGLYYLIAAVAVAVSLGLLTLARLPADLIARAVADNEPRLQLLGFATHRVKALTFALSAALAALAGGLFASHQGIVTPTSAGFALSAELVILAAVGGRFHVLGPLIGAVAVGWAAAELRDSFSYWELVIAIVFIIVVLRAPGGVAELLARALRRRPRQIAAGPSTAPSSRIASQPATLRLEDLRLAIGHVRILNGLDFEAPSNGVLAVIGPNGAGKTTALNAISGALRPTGGAIHLGTERIDGRPPHCALRSGIGRKLQVPSVFFSLSVAENLALAMMAGRARWRDWLRPAVFGWRSQSLTAILAHPSVPLADRMDQQAGTLPQGHRQFLEFAMTAAAEPRVMLLDEPCAGLSAQETALMTDLVRRFQQTTSGLVVMIEHDMSIVEAISEKVLVLHQGEVLAYGDFAAVRADPAVRAVYAGGVK